MYNKLCSIVFVFWLKLSYESVVKVSCVKVFKIWKIPAKKFSFYKLQASSVWFDWKRTCLQIFFIGFDHLFQNTYFFWTTLTGCSGLLIYALFTNQLWLYDVSITIHIRRSHQKKSTLNQHRFQILNQSKEAGRQLGRKNIYE